MDGIQPYAPQARPPVVSAHPAPGPAHAAPAVLETRAKTPADYLRALRRRVWLVLMIGVPLSVLGAVWSVRQPAIYRATAQISIEAPQYDPVLSTLVTHDPSRTNAERSATYLPNRVAYLKSKTLAERVVNDPDFLQGALPPDGDAAEELIGNLTTKIGLNSNWVTVSLEGTEPARTARQLYTLLKIFYDEARTETSTATDNSRSYASEGLRKLQTELHEVEASIAAMLQRSNAIGPGGTNIYQGQFENLGAELMHKKMRFSEFQQQTFASQLFPKPNSLTPEESSRMHKIEEMEHHRHKLITQLHEYQRLIRNYKNDAAFKHTRNKLDEVEAELNSLKNFPMQASIDPTETILATMREEIRAAEEASKAVLGQLKESMPEHQKFLSMLDEREAKLKRIGDLQTKLSDFEMLSRSQKPPVWIPPSVSEPSVPVRPKRALNIAMGIVVSFGMGIALVCLLEHLDQTVKVPEYLSVGLTLPLLGVIPRIRRNSLTHRGGHLWTPGAPESVEADAYRNLRASLLGAADRMGPLLTLLVTSAKAGEGKSTTALNLAATCARAGERTLLIDVDLRRPSLADVFRDDDPERPDSGLVDVLRGETPWQRAVVRSELPNLDFLPTGDTRDVPIEILGTLELRQLLSGLAKHYDRIILDGPAVLGLADCRMLGRVVDAAVMVVRSGSHELRPLQRAKVMLEQSHVRMAGVIFNGLYEDLQNWSSYGPYQPYGSLGEPYRPAGRRERLESAEAAHSLPLAGVEG